MTEQPGASTLTHTSGPAAGTPAIVDVEAYLDGGKVKFRHTWHWKDGTVQPGGTVDVPQKKKGDPATPIHFNLVDKTGLGIDFTDDDDGPIWVGRAGCPESKSSDPQISDIKGSPNLLKVSDANTDECTLSYRLRFKQKDGTPQSYDPDIKNGGTSLM